MVWHGILPRLRPAALIAVVVLVTGAASFGLVAIVTSGGPVGTSRMLSFDMHEQALSAYGVRPGHGATIAVVLLLIMMVFLSGFIWKMIRDERGLRVFPRPIETCTAAVRICHQVAVPVRDLIKTARIEWVAGWRNFRFLLQRRVIAGPTPGAVT